MFSFLACTRQNLNFEENDKVMDLNCYADAVGNTERFFGTFIMILLPYLFNFFELLRFRLFSTWIEDLFNADLNRCIFFAIFKPLKLIGNVFLLLLWPYVAFIRHALFLFEYKTSHSPGKNERFRSKVWVANSRFLKIHVVMKSGNSGKIKKNIHAETKKRHLATLFTAYIEVILILFKVDCKIPQKHLYSRVVDS